MVNETVHSVQPVLPYQRIQSLDVLRGIAILGILIMNIQSFSMIEAAYMNPTAYGDFTGLNRIVWIVSHVIADQKFMTIFAMLYGAGIVLMTRKAESKGVSAFKLHYRRTGWLLVIGLIHAYLLWYGDILVTYALCALVVYFAREFPSWLLVALGLIFILMASVIWGFMGVTVPFWPEESVMEALENWAPATESVQAQLEIARGSWMDVFWKRAETSLMMQTLILVVWTFWRVCGSMMIGMALFKRGFLSASAKPATYLVTTIVTCGLGFPLICYGVYFNQSVNWAYQTSMFWGGQFNYWGSLLVALGYIALIVYLCQQFKDHSVLKIFAGVGRTALSNYLLQTIICTFIFNGYGLGLFGYVERSGQILIMTGVWIIQIVVTMFWLKHHSQGPVEGVWRWLTYRGSVNHRRS